MFWALTQVALAGPGLQPEPGRASQSRGAPSATSTVRTGSENEGRTLRKQAAGPVDVDVDVPGRG